tara:strand:+ start:1983 stop:2156 length:174 start_codon:yes stop_codon:yes gene_type:complete
MDDEVIELYRNAGFTPEQTIKSLAGLLGAAILSMKLDVNNAEYENDLFMVDVRVAEK